MLDAVLFDLDSTLLTYDQDRGAVVETAFSDAGVERFCSDEALRAAADDVPTVDSDHEFLTELFRIAAERHDGPTHRAADLARAYEAAVDHTAVSFRPGAATALDAAREHARVGLVTNGERATQEVKLDSLGIDDAFETIVYAGESTPPKPDPEPFETALDTLDAAADRALFVGNSLAADVVGAKRVGCRAGWYPGETDHDDDPATYEYRPDHQFETLAELPPLLADR